MLEIALYVEQRMAGRMMVGDGKIIAVIEDGRRRTPKSDSFKAAVKHIMDNTDLEPIGRPVQVSPKSYLRTYKYTYRKPGVYIQTQYDKWACAYPEGRGWKVKIKGRDIETFYVAEWAARKAVDVHVGTETDLKELRRKGMVG